MPDDLLALLRSDLIFPVVLIALTFLAILTSLKRGLKAAGQLKCMDARGVAFLMEVGQPVLGGMLGLVPGVFPVDIPVGVALLLGVVAGFLSPQLYKHGLKVALPTWALGSDTREPAPRRKKAPPPDRAPQEKVEE